MSVFLIKAYEDMYRGLHGMNEIEIVELNDRKDAEDYAEEMSRSVIESYSEIMTSFEEDANYNEYEEYSNEWHNFIEECIEDDIAYEIYEIKDDESKTWDELIEEFEENSDKFLKKYCIDY